MTPFSAPDGQKALGLPLRTARLAVPLPVIEQRLAGDVTSGRRDDVREAAASIAVASGRWQPRV